MVSILAFIHIFISIFLVILVLIQDPKGGGAGGMFGGGGGSNSLFGATGAPTFLSKLTRYVAGLFAISCIVMTVSIKPGKKSVLDGVNLPAATSTQEETMPAAEPEAAPAEETEAPAAEQ